MEEEKRLYRLAINAYERVGLRDFREADWLYGESDDNVDAMWKIANEREEIGSRAFGEKYGHLLNDVVNPPVDDGMLTNPSELLAHGFGIFMKGIDSDTPIPPLDLVSTGLGVMDTGNHPRLTYEPMEVVEGYTPPRPVETIEGRHDREIKDLQAEVSELRSHIDSLRSLVVRSFSTAGNKRI